jgi:protein-S-isoprenylcysteine O-methyltransferase Ste14
MSICLEANPQPPMVKGTFAFFARALALVLVLMAVCRWQSASWGEIVWLAAFIAMLAIRIPHSIKNRRNVIVAAQKDLQEKLLLIGILMAMMVLPLLQIGSGIFSFADYHLPEAATWIGAVLQVPALFLFWRAHADLGRNWSPSLEVRENQNLVTRGVYTRVRHPMYAAVWLAVLAQPLLIQNWIAGALVVPAFAAMWLLRVPREEALLRQTFGAEYEAYCARTGRLLPKFGS